MRILIAFQLIPHAFKLNFILENSSIETLQADLASIGVDIDIDVAAEIGAMDQMAFNCVDLAEGTKLPEGFDSIARFKAAYPGVPTFYKKHGMLPSVALVMQPDLHKFINSDYLSALDGIIRGIRTVFLGPASTRQVKLTEVPSEIRTLTGLKELKITSDCSNINIPFWHRGSEFRISSSQRIFFPETLWTLKQLTSLELSGSSKGFLPRELTTLLQLEELIVSRNELTEIPAWIGDCRGLRALNLSDNALETLPVELKKCAVLDTLDLQDNPLLRWHCQRYGGA